MITWKVVWRGYGVVATAASLKEAGEMIREAKNTLRDIDLQLVAAQAEQAAAKQQRERRAAA